MKDDSYFLGMEVFNNTSPYEGAPIAFNVYAKDGKFWCEFIHADNWITGDTRGPYSTAREAYDAGQEYDY